MIPSNTHPGTAARGLWQTFLLAVSGLLTMSLAAPASALAQGVIQFSAGSSASARYRVNDDGTNLQTLAFPQTLNRRIMSTARRDYPGGRQYLYVQQLGNTNNLFAWSEGTGQSKALTNFQAPLSVRLNAPLWSNDGLDSFVSFQLFNSVTGEYVFYRAHVSATDITSANYQPITLGDPRLEVLANWTVEYYWWSHDGSRFYYPDPPDRSGIRVKIVGVGSTINDDPIIFNAPAELVDLRVIPPVNSVSDRYLVAAAAHADGILGIDLETSTWWWLATPASSSNPTIWGPCFSPDGSTIAFGNTRYVTSSGPGKKKTTTYYYGVYKVPFFGGPVTRVTELNSGGDVTVNNWFIP